MPNTTYQVCIIKAKTACLLQNVYLTNFTNIKHRLHSEAMIIINKYFNQSVMLDQHNCDAKDTIQANRTN